MRWRCRTELIDKQLNGSIDLSILDICLIIHMQCFIRYRSSLFHPYTVFAVLAPVCAKTIIWSKWWISYTAVDNTTTEKFWVMPSLLLISYLLTLISMGLQEEQFSFLSEIFFLSNTEHPIYLGPEFILWSNRKKDCPSSFDGLIVAFWQAVSHPSGGRLSTLFVTVISVIISPVSFPLFFCPSAAFLKETLLHYLVSFNLIWK